MILVLRWIKSQRLPMSGNPKSMSQIKQLIIFRQQGKGKKTIARLLE
jgi:hypothetical protein